MNSLENQTIASSLDITQERIEQLKKLFPDAISEGQIDFKRLKADLGDNIAKTNEIYELSWAGKSEARREIQKRTTATLRPDTANSVNWDATQNLYIEGENLEVLRTLQKAYFGKVKMIYIDPPYNTGNDSFVYPDDYSERLAEYRARTSLTDEAGFLNKQDMWKKNTKENGQFHSVWLSMMYPRLFLARNLLREDGVIFVSIDDNEAADLKLLMDEIFGEDNFVNNISVKMSESSGVKMSHVDKRLPKIKETVFLYKKNDFSKINAIKQKKSSEDGTLEKYLKYYSNVIENFEDSIENWKISKISDYLRNQNINPDKDAIKSFQISNAQRVIYRTNNPSLTDLNFKTATAPVKSSQGIDYVWWEGKQMLFLADYIDEYICDLWTDISTINLNKEGATEFKNGKKPLKLLNRCLKLATDKNDLILDFFSGSGTTAQAVLELNEEDGGNRKFICVQMPEILEAESDAYKAGYKTIPDIGRTRIQKAIEEIRSKSSEDNKSEQDLGFKSFKLAPSNFKEWRTDIENADDLLAQMEYHIDSTKPDSLPQSMVYELLLKLALPITTPIVCHTIQNEQQVYIASLTDTKPVAMFFNDVSEEIKAFILKTKPAKVICLNKAFNDSQALTNFSLQLKDADIALEVL